MRLSSFMGFVSLTLLSTGCMRQQNCESNVVEQTFVHKYGVEVPQDYWSSSGEDGSIISNLADGTVVNRMYSSGILNGETTYTFPHSNQIKRVEIYDNGFLSKSTEFYFDGTPYSEAVYDASGIKRIVCWYYNAIPKSIEEFDQGLLRSGEYFTTANQCEGRMENYAGTRLIRDDYGQLVASEAIENGVMALKTTYHPNGSPKEVIPYKNGVVNGIKRTFNPAGEPNTIESWIGGEQEGLTLSYLHGERCAEIPYRCSVKHGVEKRYREGELLIQEVNWENGLQHGATTTYIGKSSKTDWFFRGNPTTKVNYDFMMNRPVVR